MKLSKYSEPQIMGILRQAEGCVPVSDLCREHGMSSASFYKWRSKYGGMFIVLPACLLFSFCTYHLIKKPFLGFRRNYLESIPASVVPIESVRHRFSTDAQ